MEQREGAATGQTLTLDELAAIAAEIDAGRERDEVLANAGLSSDAWDAAQERWLAKLAADAAQGKLKKSRRYIKLLETHKANARAKAKQTRQKPEAPIPAEPRSPSPPLAQPLPRPLPAPETTTDLGTLTITGGIQLAKREPIPFSAPQHGSAEPRPARASHPSSPDLRALPFQSSPPAAASQVPAQAPAHAQAHIPAQAPTPAKVLISAATTIDLSATVTGPLSPFVRDVIPFRQDDAPPDSDAPTTIRTKLDPSKNPSALPFKPPQQPAQPRTASSAPPPKPASAAPPSIPLSTTVTVPPEIATTVLTPLGAVPREAMPFRSPTPPPAASPAARPAASPAPPPPPALSEADRKRVDAVTLNEYAQICAAVRRYPDNIPWLRAQLHFTEAAWTALHAVWQERFARSPELRERWRALIQLRLQRP